MNDINDDARALFDAARSGHEPTPSDHERVLRGVLARGAVAAATGSAVGTAAAKTGIFAGALAVPLKVGLGVLIGFGAAAGAYQLMRAPHSAPAVAMSSRAVSFARPPQSEGLSPAVPASQTPPEPAPLAAPPVGGARAALGPANRASEAAPEASAVSPNRIAKSPSGANGTSSGASQTFAAFPDSAAVSASDPSRASASSAAVEGSAAASTLSRESRALADVQRALREGRSADALRLLELQRLEFPGGVLGQEREAARVVALCAAGRTSEARAAASQFLAANPRSPVAARIRNSCAFP